jgi:hypothetical protein
MYSDIPCLRIHGGKCQQASSMQLSKVVEIKPCKETLHADLMLTRVELANRFQILIEGEKPTTQMVSSIR